MRYYYYPKSKISSKAMLLSLDDYSTITCYKKWSFSECNVACNKIQVERMYITLAITTVATAKREKLNRDR